MKKKGQGISINVIIVAAIALLVLVILSVIFTGRLGFFGVQSAQCSSLGGSCGPEACNVRQPAGEWTGVAGKCEGDAQICCARVGAAG